MGVPREGDWQVIFDSDKPEFGGSGYQLEALDNAVCSSQPYPWNGCDNSIQLALPGLSGIVLKRIGKSSYVPPKPKKTPAKRAAKGADRVARGEVRDEYREAGDDRQADGEDGRRAGSQEARDQGAGRACRQGSRRPPPVPKRPQERPRSPNLVPRRHKFACRNVLPCTRFAR